MQSKLIILTYLLERLLLKKLINHLIRSQFQINIPIPQALETSERLIDRFTIDYRNNF